MWSIDSHEKYQPSYFDDVSSGGGNASPSNSTIEALVSLSETIDFIGCCLKCLEHNSIELSNVYFQNIECMFQKITVELPKALIRKIKCQPLLHAIGGDWCMKKFNEKLPPIKKHKLSKKSQEKEDEIK